MLPFPIVGIGASAGGLDAFMQLLKHLPKDTGFAFVVVQHLSPQHESELAQLLGKVTSMPVEEVTNNLRVEPNHVYVIPPNMRMRIEEGVLKLQPRPVGPVTQLSIDLFFESLAQDRQERAIGVVLSGTANDGTLGLEAIKSEGGLTFAQDDSARYDSMPRSAFASGCVDLVLSPKEIATELARIARHPWVRGDAEPARKTDAKPTSPGAMPTESATRETEVRGDDAEEPSAYQKILMLLRNHTGVDFFLYKDATIRRRILRRMALNKHETFEQYQRFLNGSAEERDALYSDALINVTSFFRNPGAFDVLKEKVFPVLLRRANGNGHGDEPLRVWVVGCSGGQEAYSLAMAYTEVAETVPGARKIQIFATDLSDVMLDRAREGFYAKGLLQGVSPARMARFFTPTDGGYCVVKWLRELVVFARHDLAGDPPFSRMDLISCRNLMIYFELPLQRKIIPTFYYSLKTGGYLFLGGSESVAGFTDLFDEVDKRQKIFLRKLTPPTFHLPVMRKSKPGARSRLEKVAPGFAAQPDVARSGLTAEREADRITVKQFAPPAVLIDAEWQILQFRGATGRFLEAATGKASFDLLKMARDGLKLALRTLVRGAMDTGKTTRQENVALARNDQTARVNIEVLPLKNLQEPCYLVIFEEVGRRSVAKHDEAGTAKDSTRPARGSARTSRMVELERELAETHDYLQSLQEQHEKITEELQASSEEGQSANEELQSLNEELETSKEELESTNEELTTINEEMAHRNVDLNRLNSDLTNLQASTKMVIILLGRDLNIRRFSPQAELQFKLTATDIGFPVAVIRHHLEMSDLEAAIASVITTGRPLEKEVRDSVGRWHSLQIRPYMNSENRVEGAVLVLVDIDEMKRSSQELSAARDLADSVIESTRDPMLILDSDLTVERANKAFFELFKLKPEDTVGRSLFEIDQGQWNDSRLRKFLQEVLPRHSYFNDFELTADFMGVGARTMLVNGRALEKSGPSKILMGIQDITELLHFQSQVRRSELRYRAVFEAAQDGVLLVDPETRKILDANPFMTKLLGYSRESLVGKELFEIGLMKDGEASRVAFTELRRNGYIRYEDMPLVTREGASREVEFVSNLYTEGGKRIIQCNIRDVTERKRWETKLAEKARLLDLTDDAIIVRDLKDCINLWNKGAEKMYGWRAEEVMGLHLHTLMQTQFPRPMAEILADLYRDGSYSTEVTQTAKDGRLVTSLCRWVLDLESEAILTSYTDLTGKKRIEAELRESEQRYRNLFNSIDEGFCVIDVRFDEHGKAYDYLFVETNPSFEEQSGMTNVIGRTMREIAPDHEEIWFETYGKVATTGEPIRFTSEAVALQRWFDVYALRVGEAGSTRVAVLFSDITDRKRNEHALVLARERLGNRAAQLESMVAERTAELSSTNRQLEAFAYSIAHDLRAPLRAMQGFSTMLVEEVGAALSVAGRNYASRIARSAHFMDLMLGDLLAFSRVSQQKVNLSAVDLGGVVRNVMERLENDIAAAKAKVEWTGAEVTVCAHAPTLNQMIFNLVSNALKFVRPDAAPVVTISAEPCEGGVRVWVKDNGPGIAVEHQEQIFRPFTRLEGEKHPGSGIGLAIVQKGADRMGGSAGVESTPGSGSRFWIQLREEKTENQPEEHA